MNPLSRERCTQPLRVTVWPTCWSRSSPQLCVLYMEVVLFLLGVARMHLCCCDVAHRVSS